MLFRVAYRICKESCKYLITRLKKPDPLGTRLYGPNFMTLQKLSGVSVSRIRTCKILKEDYVHKELTHI